MIVKQVFKINQFISRISASAGIFAKSEKAREEGSEAGSQASQKDKNQKDESKGLREQISSLVQKINEANKYFLGVKYNTNYLKINKVLTYEEACAQTAQKATINDIPLEFSTKQLDIELFNSVNQQTALTQKSAQVVFSHSRLEPTINQMKKIVKNYIISLAKKTRLQKIQPNFELQIMKTFKALGNTQLILQNEEDEPQIKIKSVTLMKGLTPYRNANYSTDSFDKNESQAADGIISYRLYRQAKEEYPEIQWFSTKNINARFEILVKGGPSLKVSSQGVQHGSTANTIHSVVIETDLAPPPLNSEHLLTPQQFLRSYRLKYNSLILTNYDRKNQFYPLTYTETQKKTILINKIT